MFNSIPARTRDISQLRMFAEVRKIQRVFQLMNYRMFVANRFDFSHDFVSHVNKLSNSQLKTITASENPQEYSLSPLQSKFVFR